MKRADSLLERVRTIFGARNDAGQRVALVLVEGPGNVVVEETSASGFAHVECRVPADSALFEAPISDDLDPVALRHRAWNLPRVPLRGWVTAFEHVRVEKEKGRASLDLRVGGPLSEL